MRKPNRTHQFFEIEIEKLVYGGDGLGRHQGKVVFVPYSVPGDRLRVRPVLEKKNYVRGEILEILFAGPGRSVPVCPHFRKCGGCHWQHLEYPLQLAAKEQILREIFHHRFPHTRNLPIGMAACPTPYAYRSRARIQIRNSESGTSAGFFRPRSHSVEAIDYCPLLRTPLNRALRFLGQHGYDSGGSEDIPEWDIASSFEEDTWAAAPVRESGANETVLKRTVGGFIYRVTPSVFFQANDFLIAELVRLVCDLTRDTQPNAALDLFSGVGLFTLPLSNLFKSVTAIENSPRASLLCRENAFNAEIGNIKTVCADVAQWTASIKPEAPREFTLVLLDPPRAGAGEKVMRQIRSLSPQTILYVSCDPQTLGRDLSHILCEEYRIDRIEGLDMFPQTYHFETVVRLKRL